MAIGVFGAGIPGEDASLPGGPGDDVVQGAAAGVVVLRGLDHHPVHHPMMGTVVVTIARVVALFELSQGLAESLPAVVLLIGGGMDDDHI